MKPYQEKMLKMAGFTFDEDKEPLFDGVLIKRHWWRNDLWLKEDEINFNSLDWLEEYIMPAVRKEYGVFSELYKHSFVCELWIPGYKYIGESTNGSKIEALNNALEELVNE